MRSRARFTTILALLLALALAGAARAESSFTIEGESRLTASGRLTLQTELVEVICEVAISQNIERSVGEIVGYPVARYTEVRASGCRTSSGTFRAISILGLRSEEEGWMTQYESILGTLPTPTGYRFRLDRMQVQIEATVLETKTCLFSGSIETLTAVEARGALERTVNERTGNEISLARTVAGRCPRSGRVLLSLTPGQSTRITLSRREAVFFVSAAPNPATMAAGVNFVAITLRNDSPAAPIRDVRVQEGGGGRYRAALGSCVEATTYAANATACVMQAERVAGVTGVGSVSYSYRFGGNLESSFVVSVVGN